MIAFCSAPHIAADGAHGWPSPAEPCYGEASESIAMVRLARKQQTSTSMAVIADTYKS